MAGPVEECRICGSTAFVPVLNLGHIPPVDTFLSEEDLTAPETHYPLNVVMCEGCGLVQLNYVVPRDELFHDEYAYDMSVTDAGVAHFHRMAETVDERYPDHASVLDIGSNTGVLLDGFAERGWDVLGVEPSHNVCSRAIERGIPTENTFFTAEMAADIRDREGEWDVITATNVLAHIDDLHDAVRGIKTLLADNGVFIFEVPYLVDLIEQREFDTVYHEHLSYFSVSPLIRLFDQFDMEIIDIVKQDIHGGSIRVHVARQGTYGQTDAVQQYRQQEAEGSIHTRERMMRFAEQARQTRRDLVTMVHELLDEGHTVAGIGAPAKGVTLLNYCGFDAGIIPYVSEKAEMKIGKYVPGTHNRVVSDAVLCDREPAYALLLPWNFADAIMDNLQAYREQGGRFIVPVPSPRIVG